MSADLTTTTETEVTMQAYLYNFQGRLWAMKEVPPTLAEDRRTLTFFRAFYGSNVHAVQLVTTTTTTTTEVRDLS